MSVRIVTDSGCDLAPEVADELGIEVVPLSIRFGDTEYTDWDALRALMAEFMEGEE